MAGDGSLSFYLFDIDDNLLYLPTRIYLWNAETKAEMPVSSRMFANIQGELGRPGRWQAWAIGPGTFRDFRDRAGLAPSAQSFVVDVLAAVDSGATWQGRSWPLLVHASKHQRPIAMITARGHAPETIEAAIDALVARGLLAGKPPILGIFSVTNEQVLARLGVTDPSMTVPSVKKIAIKRAVQVALERYGATPPHRFGMSDDDPNNVVLAISAMRDCKQEHPDKRFFVINTNDDEFVKLEVFRITDQVSTLPSGAGVLQEATRAPVFGGAVSIYVSNLDRAVEFYTSVLQLRVKTKIENEWVELDVGKGFVLGLHVPHEGTARPGSVGAYNIELDVTRKLEEIQAELRTASRFEVGEIERWPHVHLLSIKDPDGNALLLSEQVS